MHEHVPGTLQLARAVEDLVFRLGSSLLFSLSIGELPAELSLLSNAGGIAIVDRTTWCVRYSFVYDSYQAAPTTSTSHGVGPPFGWPFLSMNARCSEQCSFGGAEFSL